MIYVVYFVYDSTGKVLKHDILEEYSHFGPVEVKRLSQYLRLRHGSDINLSIGTVQNGERQILLDTRTN